jgi:hypothetical protein
MKIYGQCGNCKDEINYSTSANTRIQFAMRNEENLTLTCTNCQIKTTFHVDELYARESKVAHIVAGLIFLLGTPLILFLFSPVFLINTNPFVTYIFGGFLLIPVIVFGIIKQQDRTRVNCFNRNKLKGRITNYKFKS